MGLAANARGDLARDELRNSFNSVRVGPDTSELRITTETGGREEIKRAAVRRTGETVRVTLVQSGGPPSDLPRTLEARGHCVIIRIGERLGDREVVDGSRRFFSDPGRGPERLRRERDRRAWEARRDCRRLPANFYGEEGR
jgi:hypothetical protein